MLVLTAALLVALGCSHPASTSAVKLIGTIPLPGVKGRIDHFAIDPKTHRLFVAALGNGTVEVMDYQARMRLTSIKHFKEPQGLCWLPSKNALAVADGETGDCTILDGATFKRTHQISLGGDADNMRVQPGVEKLYVGYGSGGIATIDLATMKVTSKIPLPEHPEAFMPTNASLMYVNVPSASAICVLDRSTNKVIDTWKPSAGSNYPMDASVGGERIYVGCRNPAKLLVYDTVSGKELASVDIGEDVDDVFFDLAAANIYVSCGSGELDVIHAKGEDYRITDRITTAPGARTSFFAWQQRLLFVAAPARDGNDARILIFSV